MIPKFASLVIAVVIGMFAYTALSEAYVEYKHKQAVSQCQEDIDAPSWASDATNWACERWAK